jgi:hypothetical protein
MEIPTWAPAELVARYQWIVENEKANANNDLTTEELNDHARKNDFPNWVAMEVLLRERKLCLERLITHESVRSFWDWLQHSPNDKNVNLLWLCNEIDRVLTKWYAFPRMTKAELKDDYADIAVLAKKLATKIAKYEGSYNLPTQYTALIPARYFAKIESVLHPELIAKFNAKGRNRAVSAINQVLPSFAELLNVFSGKVTEIEPHENTPRKARSESALRRMMIDVLIRVVATHGLYHSTHWASFLSVALDDDTITDATVRMAVKASDWYETAKDSGFIS